MALHRRRRIFRSGSLGPRRAAGRGGWGGAVLAGVAASLLAGGGLLFLLPAQLFGRVPAMTGRLAAPSLQVAVVDGQTLRLHDTVIRLQGVAAPPRGTLCLEADGRRFDCGAAASAALAALVRGEDVVCRLFGRDAAGFPLGQCDAGGTAINRAVIAGGWARARGEAADGPAAPLAEAESEARQAQRGLWVGGHAAF